MKIKGGALRLLSQKIIRFKRAKRKLILFVLFICMLLTGLIFGLSQISNKAQAATSTCNWTDNGGVGDNKWSTATNWDCGVVPDNTKDVALNGTSNMR